MFEEYKWLSPKFKRTMAIVEPMLEMLKKEGNNLKILDAGCGNGAVSELLIKKGHIVFGTDENEEALKEAKKRGVKISRGNLEKNISFEDDSLDVVWCLRALEHIFHTEGFLKECYRVLKKKGCLIVTADNMASLPNRIRLLFGLYPLRVAPSENYLRFTDHVRCFTKSSLKEVLEKSGFKIEKITSDFICFNFGEYNQAPWSKRLGNMVPSLGSTLIAKVRKPI